MPIYARITIDGARAECFIKRRIAPEYWDVTKGQASETYFEASVLNEYLTMVRAQIGKHYNILLSTQDHVTAQHVKNSYLGDRTKKKAKKTFLLVFKLYLQMLEEKVNARDLSKGRYKRFGVLYGKCEAFIKHKFKVSDILPEEMKLNFVVGFEHYLRTVQSIGHNTAMKYAKDLKQVMTYATIEEDILYNPFQSFKCTYKKVKRKYLDQDELTLLQTKEFSIQRLDEVRDCSIFSCYTDYAYSDAAALTPDDIGKGIDGNMWILRDRGKTDEVENVPLLPAALRIIEKYIKTIPIAKPPVNCFLLTATKGLMLI